MIINFVFFLKLGIFIYTHFERDYFSESNDDLIRSMPRRIR
jgi:hypothetical protein